MRTMSYDADHKTLVIRDGKDSKVYGIDREAVSTPLVRVYRLTKLVERESYFIAVAEGGEKCGCKGWEYRKACRHIAAVRKLESMGKL